MKKMIIALAVAAMAVAAQAALVNGDFSGAAAGGVATGASMTYAAVGMGWYTNNQADGSSLVISGGTASRNATGPNAMRSITQFFTLVGATGTRSLQYDLTIIDSSANLDYAVQLYGWNQTGAATTLLSGDGLLMGSTNSVVSVSGNYAETELVNQVVANGGAVSGLQSFSFTASTDYEFYGIRITANKPDAGDSFVIDNVAVVPEPATVGMLGLGALITLLIRRIRA